MTIRDRIKKILGSDRQPPQSRTLPDPARVNLADREVHDRYFLRLAEWSSYTPAPPMWQLPDIEEQRLWIDGLIESHAERGGLDGLVPDLLDRPIHHEMAELRHKLDDAHTQAIYTAQTLWEQAKRAQAQAGVELSDLRQRAAIAEQGYAAAYSLLTGEPPASASTPMAAEPTCITTRVAPTVELPATPGATDATFLELSVKGEAAPLHLAR